MSQPDPAFDTIIAGLAADGIFERAHPALSREAVIEIARLLDDRPNDPDRYEDVLCNTDDAVLLAVDLIRQGKQGDDPAVFLACVAKRVRDPSIDGRARMAWWAASLQDPDPALPERPWERLAYHWSLRYFEINPSFRKTALELAVAIARSALSGTIPPEARASAFPPLLPAERTSWEDRLTQAQAALDALTLE